MLLVSPENSYVLGTARELCGRERICRLKVGRAAGSPVQCTETGRDFPSVLKIHRAPNKAFC